VTGDVLDDRASIPGRGIEFTLRHDVLEVPGVKRPGSKAQHLHPSTAEDKNIWSYSSTSPICLQGVVLNYAQKEIYFHSELPHLYNLSNGILGNTDKPTDKMENNYIYIYGLM
jgi:hypothetical protein